MTSKPSVRPINSGTHLKKTAAQKNDHIALPAPDCTRFGTPDRASGYAIEVHGSAFHREDFDTAHSARLSKEQILIQSGIALLGVANQQAGQILSLLQVDRRLWEVLRAAWGGSSFEI